MSIQAVSRSAPISFPLWTLTLILACSPVIAEPVRDLNTLRDFPRIESLEAWKTQARDIREQALVSCGLWPMPERTPLYPQVFGRVERDGYTIEKVAIQTFPGCYLGGNLYRPLGHGKGPFPAILNPHGHWSNGRMADNKDGSIAARCISFARQGMIAFSYDMVGYNDTFFSNYGDVPVEQFSARHHRFATNEANLLWNISLMGLQTWNSIRALDFLGSLPDADRKRLACTGESGGGTQTFMLGAIDNRLSVQAPIVMVSHSMQGGCLCENAPGLRVEYSNMEIAACPAPRPQILVAASGDWTKDTLTVEGPSIQGIYRLFGAQDRFHFVRFNFDHNYNQTSREAVYGWFNKCLLGSSSFAAVPEAPYTKEPDLALRVWPDGKLPAGAKSDSELISYLEGVFTRQLDGLFPNNKRGLRKFKQTMFPAWKHTLQLNAQSPALTSTKNAADAGGAMIVTQYQIGPAGSKATSLRVRLFAPSQTGFTKLVVYADPEARETASTFTSNLVQRGVAALVIEEYSEIPTADQFANFYCVYNRTKAQHRVADLERACTFARTELKAAEVVLCGQKAAGLWALLAAPAADAVVADCNALNVADESKLLAPDIFIPGLLRTRCFETAAVLAAPNRLLLFNTGSEFPTSDIERTYHGIGARANLQINPSIMETIELCNWLCAPTARPTKKL
jgi:hypothetical protein